ncbi:ATP-binding protein [Brevundimonas goettingensis]|uniref:histidine kinase n=1 Tax=Brevundimonas goettingensis TaxID=2774190 RepID=A0A975GVN4_9CAUL|nr:ATP-binding protein [Brevundimonas goettingensis]QTC91617.1 HAMP domain-containing protein [Brevundimonas goettingensis]
MKRPSSLPVLVSVGALAALAVVMSQAVAFAVIILAPEPAPAGYSLASAAEALQGLPAKTTDGRKLVRRIGDRPIAVDTDNDRRPNDPLVTFVAAGLAQRLKTPVENVRVRIEHRGPPFGMGRRRPGQGPFPGPGPGPGPNGRPAFAGSQTSFVFVRPDGPPPQPGSAPDRPPLPEGRAGQDGATTAEVSTHVTIRRQGSGAVETTRQFNIIADRLNFDPFSASVKLPDGKWATVEPPRSLISPWQMRLLISLLISMAILAPIVWLLARRLTRPIRVFAEAAERLGADPDAEPLKPTGPTEVRTAIAAFNDMQASLRDHMRKRTQTIAAIAHDLRTPLTRIRFRVELAPPKLRDRMVADVEEMDALIGQAMAFVRGETQAERREPLDLDALARDCAGGFSETGAAVTFDGGRALPVEGDPAALRRAIANLIENGVKFADAARVRTFLLDDQAVISVEDDGPGLPEEELEMVFEPFARGERSRNRETGGAGLGLSVARQAARSAGGDVNLINRPEGGLTALMVLPLKTETI